MNSVLFIICIFSALKMCNKIKHQPGLIIRAPHQKPEPLIVFYSAYLI